MILLSAGPAQLPCWGPDVELGATEGKGQTAAEGTKLLIENKVNTIVDRETRGWFVTLHNLQRLLSNRGQRSRTPRHLVGRLPLGWMKKGLVSLHQAVHCNPAQVAYRTHCLSPRCLSSFPQTDSSPLTCRHARSLPRIQTLTCIRFHSKPPPPASFLCMCWPVEIVAVGGKSNRTHDLNKCGASSFEFSV